MGYYLRLLTPSTAWVPQDVVEVNLLSDFDDLELEFEPDTDEWETLVVTQESGASIVVERTPVTTELGAEELDELREEARDGQPASAARWLDAYLARVQTIYALEISGGISDDDDDEQPVHHLLAGLQHAVGGLVQADHEGFSNEDGYHILWQFSDGVTGPWKMAVLDAAGHWVAFEMELGDRAQRACFLRGEVPPTARRL